MDRKQIVQVLGPAAAVGGLVVLIGVLVALNDRPADGRNPAGPAAPAPADGSPPPPAGPQDDTGMADAAPSPDATEWKPGPGQMKVWDVKVGDGPECPKGADVTIHYTGWLTDGTVFDSSRTRGQPADFNLGGLIRGWQEGIPGMKAGGIRRLLIPSDWGYGARGSPPKIPGGATLIFEVKLLRFGR